MNALRDNTLPVYCNILCLLILLYFNYNCNMFNQHIFKHTLRCLFPKLFCYWMKPGQPDFSSYFSRVGDGQHFLWCLHASGVILNPRVIAKLINNFVTFRKHLMIPLTRYDKNQHIKCHYVHRNVVCLFHNYLILLIILLINVGNNYPK